LNALGWWDLQLGGTKNNGVGVLKEFRLILTDASPSVKPSAKPSEKPSAKPSAKYKAK